MGLWRLLHVHSAAEDVREVQGGDWNAGKEEIVKWAVVVLPLSKKVSSRCILLVCRSDFVNCVSRLAALNDPNVARVLAVCSKDEPLCVLTEYVPAGDLCQFLKDRLQPEEENHYSNLIGSNGTISSGRGSTGSSPNGTSNSKDGPVR